MATGKRGLYWRVSWEDVILIADLHTIREGLWRHTKREKDKVSEETLYITLYPASDIWFSTLLIIHRRHNTILNRTDWIELMVKLYSLTVASKQFTKKKVWVKGCNRSVYMQFICFEQTSSILHKEWIRSFQLLVCNVLSLINHDLLSVDTMSCKAAATKKCNTEWHLLGLRS